MNCPDCGHDNLPGTELCDDCGHDLAGLDLPTPTNRLQEKIMADPLENLHPAEPLIVPPDTSVADAISQMKQQHYGCIFVAEGGKLLGIFTERDALLKLSSLATDLRNLKVREVMTPNPETLTEQDTVAFALNRMSVGGYRHLPIVRGEEPIGMVSVRGILKYISNNLL